MQVEFERDNTTLQVTVKGRIDSYTASILDEELNKNLKKSTDVVFNFADVDYISSAGIRVLLKTRKHTSALKGSVTVCGANDDVKSVFKLTGISQLLNMR